MSVIHITETKSIKVNPGSEYYVVAIGPGGNGGKGGNPYGVNTSITTEAHGGCGGGGGAGAFVFVGRLTATKEDLYINISHDGTVLSEAMSLNLVRAGDGVQTIYNTLENAKAGNSVTIGVHVGSRGGGAGGPYGVRKSAAVSNIPGGSGSHGNGAEGVAGATSGSNQYSGTGGAGGGNTPGIMVGGIPRGGAGAKTNNLSIDDQNIEVITAAQIAQLICGGNGANGTQPALNRIANTGISGGVGGAGGGAWTDGENGKAGTVPGKGYNGTGGAGGLGGLGCVWLKEIIQRAR